MQGVLKNISASVYPKILLYSVVIVVCDARLLSSEFSEYKYMYARGVLRLILVKSKYFWNIVHEGVNSNFI